MLPALMGGSVAALFLPSLTPLLPVPAFQLPEVPVARLSVCQRPTQESGIASYYHDWFNGRLTASGTTFNNHVVQAAHRSLPFGTVVGVKAPGGLCIEVPITDRGPYISGRVIDLSTAAFSQLAPLSQGVVEVTIHY